MLRASQASSVNKQWPVIHAWPQSLRFIQRRGLNNKSSTHYRAVETSLANLIITWLDLHPINPSIAPMQQFSTYRKAAQRKLDFILSHYHSYIPQSDGSTLPVPVFIETKQNSKKYNWNTKHPVYENWRAMVSRGLDRSNVDYASTRVDPAFIGFRNDEAEIHHYDKYAFFSYVRDRLFHRPQARLRCRVVTK